MSAFGFLSFPRAGVGPLHWSLRAASSPALSPQWVCRKLHLEKQGYSGQNPLGRLFLRLQVESPHVGGSSLTSLVHRTGVDSAAILLICGDGLEEQHRHGGCQLHQLSLGDDPSLRTRTREHLSSDPKLSQPGLLLSEDPGGRDWEDLAALGPPPY